MSKRRERIKENRDRILEAAADTRDDKEFGQPDYEAAVHGPCFFCGETEDYNYIEPLDEGRPLSHKNWVAKCIGCWADKGQLSRKEFIEKVDRA